MCIFSFLWSEQASSTALGTSNLCWHHFLHHATQHAKGQRWCAPFWSASLNTIINSWSFSWKWVYIYIYIHLNTYIIYIMVSAGYSKNISDHCNFIAIHLENQVSGRVCLIEDLSKVDLKWEMASGCSNFRKVVRFDDPPQEKWLKPPVWKHQFDWQKWSAELRKSNLGTLSWVANEFNLCQIHMERIVVDDRYLLHHPNFSFFPT